VKPTSDDFEPRRDGWFEHKGTWQEVVVGTVMADPNFRSKRWEVIDTAMVGPVEYGHTLWFRVREQTSGEEHTISPRQKTTGCVILTQDPRDTKTGPIVPPSDAEAIMLLVKELGAEVMATRDNETGEITCPDYTYKSHLEKDNPYNEDRPLPDILRGLIEHMRFAHQMSVNDDLDLVSAITLHGQAHNPKWPNIGKGGFPHRHVPEDLSMF
jgi:hypothetical protein